MKREKYFRRADRETFNDAYRIIEFSFPDYERRSQAGQRALLDVPEYELLIKDTDKKKAVAAMGVWHLSDFDYIEHAAVSGKARGGGIGSRIFEEYFKINGDRMIFLEVEPPEERDAKRRIKFYERLGFHLNTYEYYQPPLRKGMSKLPLQVMTYPKPIDKGRFNACKSELMETVYHKDLKE